MSNGPMTQTTEDYETHWPRWYSATARDGYKQTNK